MDKVYPRLVIRKVSCHCGSPVCQKNDGLPWRVEHHQFEGQANPVKQFESLGHQDAIDFAVSKVANHGKPSGIQYSLVAGALVVDK